MLSVDFPSVCEHVLLRILSRVFLFLSRRGKKTFLHAYIIAFLCDLVFDILHKLAAFPFDFRKAHQLAFFCSLSLGRKVSFFLNILKFGS